MNSASPVNPLSTQPEKKYNIRLNGSNIIELEYLPNVQVDLETITEAKNRGLELVGDKRIFTLLDLRNRFITLTPEAKKFAATDPDLCRQRIAEAIIVNSLPMKLMANTYLSFNKPFTPTKAFTNKDAALAWFASFDF